MILNLNRDVDDRMFNILTEAVSTCIEKNDPLRIYLRSNGGDLSTCTAIVSLINECKEFIELIGYGELYSAGFIIFFEAECEKSILANTVGMIHYPYSSVLTDARGKNKKDEIVHLNQLKESKKDFDRFLKSIDFTEKEYNEVLTGGDVYFLYSRMKELLNGKRKHNITRTRKVRGKSGGVSDVSEAKHDNNKSKG